MDASKPYIKFQITSVATAKTAYFSDITVTPDGNTVTGAVVQPLGAITLTFPTAGGAVTANSEFFSWRVGSNLRVKGKFQITTLGTDQASMILPAGYTLDLTKLTAAAQNSLGDIRVLHTGANATAASYAVYSNGSTTNTVYIADVSGSGVFATRSFANMFDSNDYISVDFEVPIAEWAGSGTVNLAQNDVEYASNSSTSTSANDTSSFAYGPAGNQIQNITATLSRRVRFQTLIQVGDAFDIELSTDRIKWFTVACGAVGVNGATVQNISTQNATVYGVGRFTVVNSTDVDILFGQYAQASNSTFAGAGEAWSAGAGGGYWRVRKTSAGAAVGFGLATSTSSGLINYYDSGSFTCYMVDGVSAVSAALTCYYTRVGNVVTLKTPGVNINNSTTARYLTTTNAATTYTWPTALTPSNSTSLPIHCRTGTSTYGWGVAEITSSGVVVLTPSPGTVWTGSSVPKGVEATSLTYTV
jgi:hypothetical protein